MAEIKVLNHGLVRLVEHMGSDLSIVRSARVEFALADTLPETKRGTGGFGSTGAK